MKGCRRACVGAYATRIVSALLTRDETTALPDHRGPRARPFLRRALPQLLCTVGMLVITPLCGCSKDIEVDTGGDPVATPGKLPACNAAPPGSVRGAAMAPVGYAGGTCFWIDRTEVSRSEYAAFLADPNAGSHLPSVCAGDTDFTTTLCENNAASGSVVVGSEPNQPIVCVDWCDAETYCRWAGKTLCKGAWGSATDAAKSSYYSACSTGGTSNVPAPNSAPETCNTAKNPSTGCDTGSCSTVPVGSSPCVTAGGVYDLSGNAREWTDECESGAATSRCLARGGSIADDTLSCQSGGVPLTRSSALPDLGFRCCAYPTE